MVILLNAVDGWVLDIINWCAGKGMLPSEKSFGMAVKIGVAGTQHFQYAGIALLLYFSLRKIVRDFREKGRRKRRFFTCLSGKKSVNQDKVNDV